MAELNLLSWVRSLPSIHFEYTVTSQTKQMCGSVVYLEDITLRLFFCVVLTETSALVICKMEVSLKAKAEMSILGQINSWECFAQKLKVKTDVAIMIMLNSSRLYRDASKHKPATG